MRWGQFYVGFNFSPFRWGLGYRPTEFQQAWLETGPFQIIWGWPSFAAELPKDEME